MIQPPDPPILAVDDLTVQPPDADAPILRGVSLEVRAGDRILLTGPSGSGKSTLLRSMVLLEPADGRITVNGHDVEPAGARALRRRIGYLPQRPVAVAESVDANLAFPRQLHDDALSRSAQRDLLARLGLDDLDPDRRFAALSGGEQQRVALVRTLSARPEVLLLDEPTASLDPDNVASVLELLTEWVDADASRALVWVGHHADEVEALATRRVALAELSR